MTGNKLAIIGCGFMGTAILQGLLKRPGGEDWQYTAVVRSEASRERVETAIKGHENVVKVKLADSAAYAAGEADVVMLGCQPGDLRSLLETDGMADKLKDKLIISLLAGVSVWKAMEDLSYALQGNATAMEKKIFRVARVIPSIGAQIGDSVTLLAKSDLLAEADGHMVHGIFARVGSVIAVPESLMNEATAIGAACHALSIQTVDAITDAGVAEGMDRAAAMQLAAQSLRSATNLFCAGGMTPEQLKTAMSTPRGITINSVLAIQRGGVPGAVGDAVRAAVRYARGM